MDLYTVNPGPIDDSILYDQDKHVSSAIWEGQERGALRCHEHTSKLDQWALTPKQIELVENAGFGYLRLIPAISLDNPLISALVERWRRETNTFHLNVGEMTVTLEDVAYLVGLATDGEPVIGVTYTSCDSVCEKFLGKAPESGYTSGGMVKLSWLKEYFSHCPDDASMEDVKRHTRAYLLYLVGSTIFSTTTGNKVPVMYLPLFENFEEAGQYAWGAAALAFLYRALGNASLKSQSTISGGLTILQCWSYYHLNIGRPKLTQDRVHDGFPFVLRWKGKQSGPTANRDVTFYRKALDALKPCDVEWFPYRNYAIMPEELARNLVLGRAKTMLICFDKAERHLPDRCLRQYGMPQPIPTNVQRWERKSRGVDGGVDLSGKMESELKEWMDRRLHILQDDIEGVEESEYLQWYSRITRKFVGRPIPMSSEFQRMTATLRDVAYLADRISVNGMDSEQIQAVSRIRCIVHEVLRDPHGESAVMSTTPDNEHEKQTRGKERVRRKGMGKRKRKDDDDSEPFLEASDIGRPLLYHCTSGVDQAIAYQADNEIDHSQLCLTASEDDEPQLSNGLSESQVPQEVGDSELHYVDREGDLQLPDVDREVDFQLPDVCKEVDDLQHSHVDKEVGEPLLRGEDKMVNGSQLCDMGNQVDESLGCNEADKGHEAEESSEQ